MINCLRIYKTLADDMFDNCTNSLNNSFSLELDVNPYSLEDWNKDLTIRLIPNSVILSIYFTIGVIGNGAVITVYHFRFRDFRDDRYFIPYLAVSDLFASLMCSIFTFALNFQQANFESEAFCKSMWFFSTMTTFWSVFMLLSITVERYLKVCKPLSFQLKLKTKRIIIVSIFVVSVALAFPSSIFYGRVPTFIASKNLTRYRCTRTRHWENNEPVYYSFVLALCSITTPICLCILYMRIGCKLYEHIKFRRQFQINSFKPSSTSIYSNGVAYEPKQIKDTNDHLKHTDNEMRNVKMFDSPRQYRAKSKFEICLPIKNSSEKKSNVGKRNKSHIYKEELSTDCSDISSYKDSNGSKSDDGINGVDRKENGQSHQPVSTIYNLKLSNCNDLNGNRNRPISCNDINVLSGNDLLGTERGNYTGKKTKSSSTIEINCTKTNHTQQQQQRNENEIIYNSPDLRRVGKTKSQKEKKAGGHLKNMHHFSWMFMLITGICVACYIPKIALILVEAVNKTFWVDIPDDQLGVALFFYRLYIFNNVCNPIIYCFFDPRFRRELKILCRCRGN